MPTNYTHTRLIINILALIIASSVATLAQNGSIKGRVLSSDNEPISFVNITLKEISKGTTSAEDGTYLLTNIKAGNYTIVTSYMGLQTQEKKVQVVENEIIEFDFQLPVNAQELQEVLVSETRTVNEKPVNIGKIAIRPMDLPQSLSVVNREILEKQQAQTLGDALLNANGVYVMGNTGGTQQELAGRGFSFGSSNTFKNGVRFNNSIMPEMSSIERVEVLKGSSAILFGNVSAGGVINLITKKPKFQSGGQLSMRVGSYDLYEPTLDFYGAINNSDKVAYRINTAYEKSRSFRESVKGERFYINPSLLFNLSKKTVLLLEGDYLSDHRTADYGIGAVNYTIPDVPRSRFIGMPWSYFDANQQSTTATLTHHLNNNWQLQGVIGYQGYDTELFSNTRPNTNNNFIQSNGNWIRGVQRNKTNEKYYIAQVDLSGHFKTLGIQHTLLFGADADRYDTKTTAFNTITRYDTINIFDLESKVQRSDIPSITPRTFTQSPINRFGVYVQDLISISNKLKLLAGLRYTYQETGSNVLTYADNKTTKTTRFDDAFTPRFGIVYQPLHTTSIFASYANSFNLNSGIDTTGKTLPPSFLDQYEVGIKNDLFNGLLSANITLYQIVNSNLAQALIPANPNYPSAQELAGEVTSKGVEVDIQSKPIQGFTFLAGYSFNETKYTQSNVYIIGSKLRYNPAHTANFSAYYNFAENTALKGVNLGASVFYIGERVAGRSTRLTVANDTYRLIPLPDFAQVDVSVGYVLENISLRLKVSNLFDVLSYYVHDDNSINPIAPRQFVGTISYKF